jgi:hypothetical protein
MFLNLKHRLLTLTDSIGSLVLLRMLYFLIFVLFFLFSFYQLLFLYAKILNTYVGLRTTGQKSISLFLVCPSADSEQATESSGFEFSKATGDYHNTTWTNLLLLLETDTNRPTFPQRGITSIELLSPLGKMPDADGMILSKDEENDAEVRREDQDRINEFGRLNARLHEVRNEVHKLNVS